MSAQKEWRNRIVGEDEVNPATLIANPANWRAHPKHQQAALSGLLSDVGWVQRVIVNQTTGHIVDGHARVALAVSRRERIVPVVYVDLTTVEEKLVLASLDPIGAWATRDEAKLEELLQEVSTNDLGLQRLLDELAAPIEQESSDEDNEKDIAVPEPGPTLSDRFMIPPFSIFNAREGWWQSRKKYWLRFGIESELGRDDALTYGIAMSTKRGDDGKLEYGNEQEKDGTTSIFDPVLTEIAYRWFSPPGGLVFDPFAGGSVRGIVASKLDRNYIGHELRSEQVEANRAQVRRLMSAEDLYKPRWIIGDSRTIDQTCKGVQVDFVFSCPPYADLEKYSDDPQDLSNMPYEKFVQIYREIIAKSCALLKPDRFACFVVGEARGKDGNYYNLVGDTVRAFKDAGLGFYNEGILVTAVGTLPIRVGKQFVHSRKLGKCHQNVLVFVKGDARRAVEACGDVEVVVPENNDEDYDE
jgi:DNA modification methylase